MELYREFCGDGWRGKVADGCQEICLAHLDSWLKCSCLLPVREVPLRSIFLWKNAGGQSRYVKVLRGLKDVKETLFTSLKWHLRPSRSLKVLRISSEIARAGFRCPRILLAARKRAWRPWGMPTDLVVMEEAPGRTVAAWLFPLDGGRVLQGDERRAMLRRMGGQLARFHAAGFVHGDCHPGNYFWQEGKEDFCYIDNDRTRHYSRRNLPGAIRNMVSAGFYLFHKKQGFQQAEWDEILDAYLRQAEFSPEEEQAFRNGVAQALNRRLERGK